MPKKSTILVVDDEPLNLQLMGAMLIPQGYKVLFASNGPDALEIANSNPPDVILLDVMMPGMDGYSVAQRLKDKEHTHHIPVVMVTALNAVEDRVQALNVGADDFLAKPVDKAELTARVRSLVKVKAYHDHTKNYQQALEDAVNKSTQELRIALSRLEIASMDTVFRLATAAEYKDEETGGHIKRISHYSTAVARKIGLNQKTCQLLLFAAPMHDVGKIGIPDRILLKPGKLNNQEWAVMRQHTTIGGKILQGANNSFLRLGHIIALTHHEKWDGSGYPQGLSGDRIPLVGQIVAIADVFDALTSHRPYKEPFSLEKSLEIIRARSGSHFAPQVVEAFFATLDDIMAIKEKYL